MPFLKPYIRKRVLAVRPHLYGLHLLLRNPGIATGFLPVSRYTENFGKKLMCSDVKNK